MWISTSQTYLEVAPVLDSIANSSWFVNADDPQALTRLLDLAEFTVSGVEYDARLDCMIVLCQPVWDVALCPNCQQLSTHVHQYHRRVVRDLAWVGRPCALEFSVRRFKCAHCRRPFTEVLEAISPHGRCTRRYEQQLFERCRDTTIQAVSRQEQLGYKLVEGIYYRLAARHVAVTRPVRRLGLDEIALKKGHADFVLILSDLERSQIIAVLPERNKEALEAYLDSWDAAQRDAIEEVAMDLWLPYRLAVEAKLPSARINGDRFHVMKNLNDCVTTARRMIQRQADAPTKQQLKGCRWLLVKNQDNLTDAERCKLEQALRASPMLAQLHQLKEQFRAIFETAADRTAAASQLQTWIATAESSGLQHLAPFLTTLRNWWQPILNYFNDHITSGLVEGLNNKVKLIKRRAYGFRNFEHFRLRLLVECHGVA
jgi:transposase